MAKVFNWLGRPRDMSLTLMMGDEGEGARVAHARMNNLLHFTPLLGVSGSR